MLPDLIRSGVASLKIEGRLKSPEYVANITRVYRTALDKLAAGADQHVSEAESYDLQMGFSRGLYSGWFRGINNQELVHARFGKKRGVFLGEVLRRERRRNYEFVRKPRSSLATAWFLTAAIPINPRRVDASTRCTHGATKACSALATATSISPVLIAAIVSGKQTILNSTAASAIHSPATSRVFKGPSTSKFMEPLDKPLTVIARDEEGT